MNTLVVDAPLEQAAPARRDATLVLAGNDDECEALALRDFNAIYPASDAATAELAQYRARRALVTPTAKRERYGVASVLRLMRCEVLALAEPFDARSHDPITHPNTPMFAPMDNGDAAEPNLGITTAWPDPLPLDALALREPQQPQFIMADWLPAGYATLLAGHGGVGKSAIGLHLAACIALGRPFFGLPTERRRVLYLSCEDREGILHWRLDHICKWLNIGMADLLRELDVLDLVGHDTVLWDRDPRTGFTVTAAYGQFQRRLERSGSQVVMVDGVSDTFAGNENARPDVKRYVNALLAPLPTDGALLLLGHVNRPAASSPGASEGYSGSTQWHNAVRARWYLYPEVEKNDDDPRPRRTGSLMLELQKSNHGSAAPAMSFRWDETARMFVGNIVEGASGSIVDGIRDNAERRAIVQAIVASGAAGVPVPAAMQGPRTAYLVLSQRPEFPDTLRGGSRLKTKRFARHIEALRQIRHVVEGSIRRSNRHAAAVLDATPQGCAAYANS